MRRIKITYDIATEESAEQGDIAESGWENEEGVPFEPDEYDIEEHGSESAAAVNLAVKWLRDQGGLQASDYPKCHPGHTWYSTIDDDIDHSTGDRKQRSFHLDGFSDEEQVLIYDAVS